MLVLLQNQHKAQNKQWTCHCLCHRCSLEIVSHSIGPRSDTTEEELAGAYYHFIVEYRDGEIFIWGLLRPGKVRGGKFSPPLECPDSQLPHAHLNVQAHAPSESERFATQIATEAALVHII